MRTLSSKRGSTSGNSRAILDKGSCWLRSSVMEGKDVLCGLATASVIGGAIYFSDRVNSSERQGGTASPPSVTVSTRRTSAEIRNPSREEIISRIPEQFPVIGSPFLTEELRDQMDVFRQLGALDGEKALDYLMAKSGGANSQTAMGLPHAMGFAFSGWMESDLKGALAAFEGFLIGGGGTFAHPGANMFKWKGKKFYSGMF